MVTGVPMRAQALSLRRVIVAVRRSQHTLQHRRAGHCVGKIVSTRCILPSKDTRESVERRGRDSQSDGHRKLIVLAFSAFSLSRERALSLSSDDNIAEQQAAILMLSAMKRIE